MIGKKIEPLQNYIYISHLGENGIYFLIPTEPDSIADSMGSTFNSENMLSRSSPIFSYAYSGPRTVQISFDLHRDMMDDVNYNSSNVTLEEGQDYIDALISALQSIAVPKYNLTNKLVEPPLVSLRIGKELFIKGIVSGAINKTSTKPILSNGKYARVNIVFTITEVDPYDATTIYKNGSFRGVTRTLSEGMKL